MLTHFNKLYSKDPSYLGHVEGLRALAALRVMIYHLVLFGALFVGQAKYVKLLEHSYFKIALSTGVLLDTFFVISGLVIGHTLIKEYQDTGKIKLFRFLAYRIARIYPLYLLVLIFAFPLSYSSFHNVWANILQINNFLPVTEQYMTWTWSLAIDFQFYILFGILMWLLSKKIIGKKTCCFLTLGIFILPFIIIPMIISNSHYYYFSGDAFVVTSPESWQYINMGYDKIHVRTSPILYGLMIAYILAYHRAKLHELIQRIPNVYINTIAFALISLIALLLINDPVWYFDHPQNIWQTSTIWATLYQRIIFSLSLCLLLLLADAPKGIIMRSLVTFLSSGLLRPFGRLSYSTFMIHPIVLTAGFMYYVPTHPSLTATSYLRFGLWMILLTYCLAALSFLYIEQPAMRFIKRKILRTRRSTDDRQHQSNSESIAITRSFTAHNNHL